MLSRLAMTFSFSWPIPKANQRGSTSILIILIKLHQVVHMVNLFHNQLVHVEAPQPYSVIHLYIKGGDKGRASHAPSSARSKQR